MSKNLIDRIDETRKYWTRELETCRNELLDYIMAVFPDALLTGESDE